MAEVWAYLRCSLLAVEKTFDVATAETLKQLVIMSQNICSESLYMSMQRAGMEDTWLVNIRWLMSKNHL